MEYFDRAEVERIGQAGAMLYHRQHGPTGRYLSQFWLYLEPNDQAFTPHATTGYWEAWITLWISNQLELADMFIDVGANVGYYTMLAAKSGVRTLAFEPNPELAKMLTWTSRLNRVNDKVVVYQEALSDKPGEAVLWVPENHSGGGSIETNGEGFPVRVDTIDNIFKGSGGNFLFKIDAEGSEPKIWAGMQNTFAVSNCTVLLEWEGSRYDPKPFAESLFANGNTVSLVNFAGAEESLTMQELISLDGLHMIVIRKGQ